MTVRARLRHPVSGRRFWLRARSARELDAYIHRIDTLRTELRLGMRSAEEVDRELRHLQHGPVPLERAVRSYLERPDLSANTRRRVRSYLAGHFAKIAPLALSALDGPRCAQWIDELRRTGLHDTSIATVWRSGLCAVAAHAAERGWIGVMPWGNYKPKLSAQPKYARESARSVEELAALLLAARELDAVAWAEFAPVDRWSVEPMIAAAALLALRQGELGGLRWHEVDFGPPVRVRIARQWYAAPLKGGRAPVWIEAVEALGEVLQRHRDRLIVRALYERRGPVFPDPCSPPAAPRAYTHGEVLSRVNLRAAVERAGLPSIGAWSAHGLRATFVTLESAASGGDLRAVASRSRHASITSLARYLRALSRSRDPAPPAFRFLPGSQDGGAGVPLLGAAHAQRDPKETPP